MAENWVYAGFAVLTIAAALGLYLFFVRYRQHKATHATWWRLLAGNLLVLAFIVAAALLAGETYFRFCYDVTDMIAITKTSQRWFARHYHVNRMGYRDDCEYAPQWAPGKRRVTFVGDSYTAGHGIQDVVDRFANRIGQLHLEWEIHVLAAPGLDSGTELELLKNLAVGTYELDHVVLVYCLNDIGDATQELVDRSRKVVALCNERQGFLIEHSFLLNTLYYRLWALTLPEISGSFDYQHQAYFDLAWQIQKLRLEAMRDVVRSRGGEFSVVTFPYMHLMGPDYEFRDVHRRLDDFWRKLGVAHLDLLPVFAPYTPRQLRVNAYDGHPNEFAHALAADAIARFLEKQPWLEGDSPPRRAPPSPASAVYERVRACYRQILEAEPGNLGALGALANALAAEGRPEEAIPCYEEMLEIDPDRAETHGNLAYALTVRGQFNEAVKHCRRALELQPGDVGTLLNLGNALDGAKRFDEAVDAFQQALEINPELAEVHNSLGRVLFRQGKAEEAVASFEKALECKPDYAAAHYNLGLLLAGREQLDAAIDHYRKALEIEPEHANARRRLDEALRQKALRTPH